MASGHSYEGLDIVQGRDPLDKEKVSWGSILQSIELRTNTTHELAERRGKNEYNNVKFKNLRHHARRKGQSRPPSRKWSRTCILSRRRHRWQWLSPSLFQ